MNVASLFGVDGADRGYADVPRTRFERKQFWLTASYSASGSGAGAGRARGSLPDGRHAWEVNASVVTDRGPSSPRPPDRSWPTSPSGQMKPRTDSRVGHRHHHPQPPPRRRIGGPAAQDGKNFRLLFEAAVTAGAAPVQAPVDQVLAGRSVRRQPLVVEGDHRERGRPVDSGIG